MASVATMRTLAPAPPSIVSGGDVGKTKKTSACSSSSSSNGVRKGLTSERPLRPLLAAAAAVGSTSKIAIAPSRPILAASTTPVPRSVPVATMKTTMSRSPASSSITPAGSPSPGATASVIESSSVQPKKEWVLPARAKPGRKPSDVEPPTKRKAQNRASQRAFRERRQSYLASLEAKVAEYEEKGASASQDIQRVARRLKEENDGLKTTNAQLLAQIQKLKESLEAQQVQLDGALDQTAGAKRAAKRASPSPSAGQNHNDADLAALTDTTMDRDCGFCTEQSFCVCSGEAVLDFAADGDVQPAAVAPIKVNLNGRRSCNVNASSACKPKLWHAQSSGYPATSAEKASRPRSSPAYGITHPSDVRQASDVSAFTSVGPTVSLRRRTAIHSSQRTLWSVVSPAEISPSRAPSSQTLIQQDAFVCPTASHWQRRWAAAVPPISHRYSYQQQQQSPPYRTLASPPFDHATGSSRPLLLSPPSLSAYSLSSSLPTQQQQQQQQQRYNTSRMTSSSRDEPNSTPLHRPKANIWPLNMLADVVTRTSDDEKSSKGSTKDDESTARGLGKRGAHGTASLTTSKRLRTDGIDDDQASSLSRRPSSSSTSSGEQVQACACPLSKIM